MPYPDLPAPQNDILLLTWREPNLAFPSIHYPGSTWNEGRNCLLAKALALEAERGIPYRYLIFLDDDCQLEEDGELAAALGLPLTGNPFRTFERFLLRWEPAVGYARYDWQHLEPGREVNLGNNFDALFNAFHREAVPFLLPYYTGFDAESWLYSQMLVSHLASMALHPYRIQCNLVRATNRNRHGYRLRKKYWHLPTTFLAGAVRSPLRQRIDTRKPNSPIPAPGVARRKDRSFQIGEDFLAENFDLGHPFFAHRSMPAPHPPAPILATGRIAVLFSGSCRGLERTAEALRRCLLEELGAHDIFMFVPQDAHGHLASLLQPTVLRAAPDRPLAEGRLRDGLNCRLKRGVQAYLQQIEGLEQCDRLRQEHERQKGWRYGAIIRCRPDLLFVSPLRRVRELDLRYLYVPDFHGFDGCNDRFAIGSPENMSVYCRKRRDLEPYALDWMASNPHALPVSAEMFTAGHLRHHGIALRTLPVRFNRVRGDRVSRDVDEV